MDHNNQTKQVFVDETGRRGRLLSAAMRIGAVVMVAYLGLLVAGFLGASWVPSVRLPIVGDIFGVDRGDSPTAGEAARGQSDHEAEADAHAADATTVAHGSETPSSPGREAPSRGRARGREIAPNPAGTGRGDVAAATPRPSPNHGTSSGNPNAGPKPKKTPAPRPSPNHGSNGNSENAGPKPKPSKDADHPSNSARNQEPDPTPSPGS